MAPEVDSNTVSALFYVSPAFSHANWKITLPDFLVTSNNPMSHTGFLCPQSISNLFIRLTYRFIDFNLNESLLSGSQPLLFLIRLLLNHLLKSSPGVLCKSEIPKQIRAFTTPGIHLFSSQLLFHRDSVLYKSRCMVRYINWHLIQTTLYSHVCTSDFLDPVWPLLVPTLSKHIVTFPFSGLVTLLLSQEKTVFK